MKFNRITKIKYTILLIFISLFLGGLITVSPNTRVNIAEGPQTSISSSNIVSILVYTEYADTSSSSPHQEFENTISAIDTYYGSNYNYQNLTKSNDLESEISNYDVLLIPEQENASISTMKAVGQNWSPTLSDFITNGGTVICLDWGSLFYTLGNTLHILNSSDTMKFTGSANSVVGNTIGVSSTPNALTKGVSDTWDAPNGAINVSTTDGTVVVEDKYSTPVVVHKYMGQGHVVYCGFDFYDIEPNCGKILANAIRLSYTPHIIFDDSHNNAFNIQYQLQGFAQDLVDMGYDVSSMTTFGGGYFNNSDVSVLTTAISNYTKTEVDVIENYVAKGKGLLICTERGNSWLALDGVLKRFGFERNKTHCVRDTDEYTNQPRWPIFSGSNIRTHPTTMGIIDIEVYATAAFIKIPSKANVLISTDEDSTSVWETSGLPAKNLPIAAALETSTGGRVITIGETGFMRAYDDSDGDGTADYDERSNGLFLRNSILWLLDASSESKPSIGIPSFPLEVLILTAILSCVAILIFIYKKRL